MMAPPWPPGQVIIDLTEDDEPASFASSGADRSRQLPTNGDHAVPKPRILSTTPIPVPSQPSWATPPTLAPAPAPASVPTPTPTAPALAPPPPPSQVPDLTPWPDKAKRRKYGTASLGGLDAFRKVNPDWAAKRGQQLAAWNLSSSQQARILAPLSQGIRPSIEPVEVASQSQTQHSSQQPNGAPQGLADQIADSPEYDELPHKQPTKPDAEHSRARGSSNGSGSPPRLQSPPKLLEKKPPRNTIQRQKALARATKWQGGRALELSSRGSSSTPEQTHRSFGITRRPYLAAAERRQIIAGSVIGVTSPLETQTQILHVDFTDEENSFLRTLARRHYRRPATGGRLPIRDLRHILKKDLDRSLQKALLKDLREGFVGHRDLTPPTAILARTETDLVNYLRDLIVRRYNSSPQCLRLEPVRKNPQAVNRMPQVLFAREIVGKRGFGTLRRYQDFDTVFRNDVEDRLEPRMQFTGCAGDIVTISWLSDNDFICGTTTHSDSHNQQYNKPGNLALGNVTKRQLVAHPGHRILRPLVSHGDNALESMRHSQDPWLFTSVVWSDYSSVHKLAFTSSFDHTVKIWQCHEGSMHAAGTWPHEGRVNYVVASTSEQGPVATAADVAEKNVRVYHLDEPRHDLPPGHLYSDAKYDEYSCSRISETGFVQSDSWSYYPAAIRWGIAPSAQHLLLVGYSPRSHHGAGADYEIPEDKLNTGELCIFHTKLKKPLRVSGAAMQNVFDVVWHPTQVMFAVATSTAPGIDNRASEYNKTQIRLFWPSPEGGFNVHKTLDCPATDINMLTLRPNSKIYSYVTASCTDSRVYVWDSSGSDRPLCVLKHGDPIDEILGDREREDVGVTFTAWSSTPDRLYTGSSDGVVKAWNIRRGKPVLVKDLVELSGPVTYGAFSPDLRKLAIGDGTGKVCILTQDEDDDEPPVQGLKLDVHGQTRTVRLPRALQPHPDVPAPGDPSKAEDAGGTDWLRTGKVIYKPGLGVSKGPNYSDLGFYRRDLHLNEDPIGPLLARHQATQMTERPPMFWPVRRQECTTAGSTHHLSSDFACLQLDAATEAQLQAERVEYDISKVDYVFSYEDDEEENEDKDSRHGNSRNGILYNMLRSDETDQSDSNDDNDDDDSSDEDMS
ncbi:uncharacterized protein B0I36DRAFT_379484 [Microdochium trichocladiopsis]|uniref:WD40-repeat-containing domain protein n=1 Tax=Microdochium trichocladiopsis TaxID=1682393 RepID=A0A9P8YIF8_9PEZI|nr:uncharacterized protein B0I36DRAFT_379484 [Microdochium trichocladiopsis]KAH7040533.1 hypothetical protein B0I36DRAFT_379484 [Microdochium trichocladiopsis]